MIELELSKPDEFEQLSSLKIKSSQSKYMMSSNERCLSEMFEDTENVDNFLPYSIYNDDEIIGFIILNKDVMDHEDFKEDSFYEKKCCFITHFMIDDNFQGNGFGKLSLICLEEKLR